jgi:hypothetical protein
MRRAMINGTRRCEEALKNPILFELAAGHGELNMDDEAAGEFVERLANLLKISEETMNARLPKSGKRVFPNHVFWAKKQLENEDFIEVEKRKYWRIKDKGRNRVRNIIVGVLKLVQLNDRSELVRILQEDDENGQDMFLNLLNRIPSEQVEQLMRESSSTGDLLIRAAVALPLDEVSGFVASSSHLLRGRVMRDSEQILNDVYQQLTKVACGE